jgi:hypothetical protein
MKADSGPSMQDSVLSAIINIVNDPKLRLALVRAPAFAEIAKLTRLLARQVHMHSCVRTAESPY